MKILLLVLAVATQSILALEPAQYSLEELEALVAKKEYAEALLHLPDVSPANRAAKWEKIVEKATIAHLQATAQEGASGALTLADEMQKTFPSLERSAAFEEARLKVAFTGFESCFDTATDAPQCTKRLMEFVQTGRNVGQLSFRAGQLVSRKYNSLEAFPFFEKAIGHLTRKTYCPDAEVRRAVVAVFAAKDESLFKRGVKFAERECWTSVKPELVKELERSPAGDFLSRTCVVLIAKDALPASVKAKCNPY